MLEFFPSMSRNNRNNKSQESRVSNPFGGPATSAQPAFGAFAQTTRSPNPFCQPAVSNPFGQPAAVNFGAPAFGASQFGQSQSSGSGAFGAGPQQPAASPFGGFGQVPHHTNPFQAAGEPMAFRVQDPLFPQFVPRTSKPLVPSHKPAALTEPETEIYRAKAVPADGVIPLVPPPIEFR